MDGSGLEARLARLLADAERITGLTVTVHDRTGDFAGRIGESFHHRHWHCEAGRNASSGGGQRCLAHCYRLVNARAAVPGCEPFVHSCWKGCSEATAPVQRDGVHRLTLFGGATRSEATPPAGLAPEAGRTWRQLPPADPERLAAAASMLAAVGQAMLAMLDARTGQEGGRRSEIDRLIEARLHQSIGPAEVGCHLGLSPSRAAHVVAQLYGMALGDLLRERRLARAKRLLLASDEAVGAIARRCGFASQHWFNRLFTRAVGEPPARWRRRQRAGA